MNPEFGISEIVGTLGLSTFVLGSKFNSTTDTLPYNTIILTSVPVALGPLLLSPLSELYGRRPIYLISWGLFVIWLIPCAVARNVETMLIVCF